MAKIRIIADSACDIPQADARAQGFRVVPLRTQFGDQEYLDGETITPHEFFDKLINGKDFPHTSQMTPQQYHDLFEEELKEYDEIIFLTLSAGMSGSYNNGCIVAEEFEGRVHMVDTTQVTGGFACIVRYAQQLVNEGKSAQEIVDELNVVKHRARCFGLLDTLEYLRKGGRISAVAAFVGNVLSIKPVIAIEDGLVKVKAKARGAINGRMILRDMTVKSKGVDFTKPVSFCYGGLDDTNVKEFMEKNKDLLEKDPSEYPIYCIGAAIGTHIGPNSIAICFFEKE